MHSDKLNHKQDTLDQKLFTALQFTMQTTDPAGVLPCRGIAHKTSIENSETRKHSGISIVHGSRSPQGLRVNAPFFPIITTMITYTWISIITVIIITIILFIFIFIFMFSFTTTI